MIAGRVAREVDWAHILVAVTNIGSVIGVVLVTAVRRRRTPVIP